MLILLACLAHNCCEGQAFFDNKYFTGYNNLLSSNVINTKDSGCVFVNYIRDSVTGLQNAGFIRLDKYGNEKAKKSFRLFNLDHLAFLQGMKHFIQGTNCSYFLAGTTYTPSNTNYLAVVTKVNRITLDTIKTKLYSDPNFGFSLNSFIKLHENKYLLVGNKGGTTITFPFMLELDSNLNVVHSFTANLNPSGNFLIYSSEWNPVEKKILLQGMVGDGIYPVTFMKMDTLGIVSNTYSSVSSHTTGIAQVFYSAIDTSYVCVGSKVTGAYSSNTSLMKLCITKYNKNLQMRWQKTYGDQAVINEFGDAVILADGSIVASGNYSKYTTLPLMNADQNGVILKVDKYGHFRWMREYNHYGPGNYRESFYGIDTTLEGGFYLCGSVMNQPKAKAWAVKTDGEGCVVPGCASSTVTVDSVIIVHVEPPDTSTVGLDKSQHLDLRILIYPNPVKDLLMVEKNFPGSAELSVFDVSGREIKKVTLEENNRIDLSGLEKGVYFIKLFKDSEIVYTGKLLKE